MDTPLPLSRLASYLRLETTREKAHGDRWTLQLCSAAACIELLLSAVGGIVGVKGSTTVLC